MSIFETLSAVNVNGHTEKKNGLTYLSWPFAWGEVKKRYPKASYMIFHDENHKPYVYDKDLGYMVFTSVTIEDDTIDMWLPVMDGANKAMKDHPYEYTVKNWKTGKLEQKTVQAATMFDVNKTIMRCLVKNLAMFGLGLYIYAGEDLPEGEEKQPEKPKTADSAADIARREAEARAELLKYIRVNKMDAKKVGIICNAYKVSNLNEMTYEQCMDYLNRAKAAAKKEAANE